MTLSPSDLGSEEVGGCRHPRCSKQVFRGTWSNSSKKGAFVWFRKSGVIKREILRSEQQEDLLEKHRWCVLMSGSFHWKSAFFCDREEGTGICRLRFPSRLLQAVRLPCICPENRRHLGPVHGGTFHTPNGLLTMRPGFLL